MKSKSVKPEKLSAEHLFFSPKIKTVKIGEMLCSKLSAVLFSPPKWKTKPSSPEKMSAERFAFSLKHQLVKRGKVLRVKLSAGMKNVCCQVVKPSFSWPIWLQLTDGTICSWGLRVAFLSNPDAVVAGCGHSCPHRNPNWHIVFVSNRVWFVHGLNLSFLVLSLVKAFFCPLETENNLFCVSASPNSPLGLKWVGIVSSLASPRSHLLKM